MQNVGDLWGGGVVCGQGSGEASQILFITEDAAVSVAAVTQATQKTKKSSTRKNMNEEARKLVTITARCLRFKRKWHLRG